jgi:hypothetical protein
MSLWFTCKFTHLVVLGSYSVLYTCADYPTYDSIFDNYDGWSNSLTLFCRHITDKSIIYKLSNKSILYNYLIKAFSINFLLH